MSGYHSGTIAVAASSLAEARDLVLADIARWIRSDNEGSPSWFLFGDAMDDDDCESVEKTRQGIIASIMEDPLIIPNGVYWQHGGG